MPGMSPRTADAIRACIASRGPNTGKLLRKAPPMAADAYAAFQGLMVSWNPHKASIPGIIFLSDDQRQIFAEARDFADAHPELRTLERDRAILEHLGVW